jgi:DNA-binding transcriptional MocR family regulator
MTHLFDLKTGYPDQKVVPLERFAEISAEVLCSGRGWQYGGDLQGILPLREQIARFLTTYSGVSVTPDELIATNGALNAIDLVCRAVTQPGDVVVVEDPTFYFVVQVLRLSHVEIVGVKMSDEGIDLDDLKRLVDRYGERLKLVYTIPSYHNPTGITATNRSALAQMAQRFNFTLLEDSTYQQLYYDTPPPLYLKLSDESGHVVSVGSMSKLLMPSLRTGWIWAQSEQIQRLKMFRDDAGSSFTAHIVADFIRSDEIAGQVEFARNFYARKHSRAIAAMDRYAPAWLDWSAPGGGFFIWATLPKGLTAAQLQPFADEHGVSYMPGRNCYVAPPDDQHLRLCFAMLDEDALEQSIARLSEALETAGKHL